LYAIMAYWSKLIHFFFSFFQCDLLCQLKSDFINPALRAFIPLVSQVLFRINSKKIYLQLLHCKKVNYPIAATIKSVKGPGKTRINNKNIRFSGIGS